jgi:SDR family mycofactocin-dependent oxidoreductase
MTGRVEGKVALISGAARGQGRSHAVRLAEEGADIIAFDICADVPGASYPSATEEDLADTVKAVEATGKRILARVADVRDYAAVSSVVSEGVARFGRLDIVSANAGIAAPPFAAQDMPEDVWQIMFDINLTGVWQTCKAAIPHLIEGGRGGSIVLTSSVAGLKAYQNVANYVAAKHGVVGLMRTLANELAQHFIRVNCLNPTSVSTDMIHNEVTYRQFRPELERTPEVEDVRDIFASLNAMPIPWIEAIDVSNALLFLASDEARYITGVALPIDAGQLVK